MVGLPSPASGSLFTRTEGQHLGLEEAFPFNFYKMILPYDHGFGRGIATGDVHNDGFHVGYMDGHVERHTMDSFPYQGNTMSGGRVVRYNAGNNATATNVPAAIASGGLLSCPKRSRNRRPRGGRKRSGAGR